jgi:mono/diheme cytochrome c family protein
VLLLAPLLLTGCGDPPPGQMKQGDELYTYYCQNCHQQSGLGPFLERLPPTEPPLQRHEIVLMIKHGYEQRKTHMPTFSQLSDQQADALAAFVIERRRAQASAPANPN